MPQDIRSIYRKTNCVLIYYQWMIRNFKNWNSIIYNSQVINSDKCDVMLLWFWFAFFQWLAKAILSILDDPISLDVYILRAYRRSIFSGKISIQVMYGCESWTVKKAEHWRTDAFELWCWRRLLRVPWTARRSNLSIPKEISPEYSLEDWCWSWNSNTLATWCEELTHLKRPWCWERLKAGGEGDNRGWDGWMVSPTQWIWV